MKKMLNLIILFLFIISCMKSEKIIISRIKCPLGHNKYTKKEIIYTFHGKYDSTIENKLYNNEIIRHNYTNINNYLIFGF